MEWLAILGLGALLWALAARVGELTRKLEALERRLPPEAKPLPSATREFAAAPGEELEPLLLDTPLPEPSNDSDYAPPRPPGTEPAPAAAVAHPRVAPTLTGALSPIQAQALGVLVILVALLAPQFTARTLWPPTGLTLYLAAVAVAGFAVSAWRRWAWAAAITALGLYCWFAAAIAADDLRRALTMVSLAAVGGVSLAFRKPAAEAAAERLRWSRLQAELPTAALSASSVLMLWAWVSIADTGSGSVARVAWVATMLVALAAASVRARVAAAATFAVSAIALALGFSVYLALRADFLRPSADFYPFILFAALAIAIAAMLARPHRGSRTITAATGAVCAALLAALAAVSRPNWHEPAAWAALFSAAAILFTMALFSAREARDAKRDLAAATWAGAGAALLFLGIESALPSSLRAAAYGGASLALAAGLAWRGWAAFRFAALSAAGFAVAHALSRDFIDAAPQFSAALLLVAVATAAFVFAASAVAARAEPRGYGSEGLGAAGVILVLIGVFLALPWASLDGFAESSLRALALMAAGHITLQREGGFIARWRGQVLLGLGLVHALIAQAIAAHPWWGLEPAAIVGPPLFNGLELAFAAPAALSLAASARLYARQRNAARIYASIGGVLGLVWALSEVRRMFHGAAMATAPSGLAEVACYALIFLAGLLALRLLSRRRSAAGADAPFTQDLVRIADGAAWLWMRVVRSLTLALAWAARRGAAVTRSRE